MARELGLDLAGPIRAELLRLGLPVLAELVEERRRQDVKWGQQNHPDLSPDLEDRLRELPTGGPLNRDLRQSIAARYYGLPMAEDAKDRTDSDAHRGALSWVAIAAEELVEALEAAADGDEAAVRTEVVQLAAVAAQWVEAIDRRRERRARELAALVETVRAQRDPAASTDTEEAHRP